MPAAIARTSKKPPSPRRSGPAPKARRTPFVGRESELEGIRCDLERGSRLVTVLGAPGIGKTRLAIEWVERHADGNFVVVPLGETSDQTSAVHAVAEGLGLVFESDDAMIVSVGLELASRGRILVVLDDAENLATSADRTIGLWLTMAPEAVFLVTSRLTLAIEGERIHEIGPLDNEAATELFVWHAEATGAPWTRDPVHAAATCLLLNVLANHPLAIELCAARSTLFTPGEMLGRSKSRRNLFELLHTERRDASARHRSLEAAITCSWTMLGALDKRVLAQCARLSGPFTLEAAEAAVDTKGHLLVSVFERLRAASLVRAVASPGAICFEVDTWVGAFARAREESSAPTSSSPPPELPPRMPAVDAGAAEVEVAHDASWFQLDEGPRVVLSTRKPLRRLLTHLVEKRIAEPGVALDAAQLIVVGWPGERMTPSAGKTRLHNAIATLRRMGLRPIVTRSDGYLLDASSGVRLVRP